MTNTKHGHRPAGKAPSPTYRSWHSMKQRVLNPNDTNSRHYSERGITMHESWKEFANFLADMGERPPGTNLERIENDKGYQPGNCRWATQAEQMRNRRTNVFLEFNGKRQTVQDWSRETGIPFTTIRTRMKAGWPVERILDPTRHATNQFTKSEISSCA